MLYYLYSSSSSGSEGQNNLSHYFHDGYENCFVPTTSTPGRTWDFNRRDHTQQILPSIGTACKGPPFTVWVHHAKGKQQSYYHIVAPPLPLYQPMNFIFDSCIVVIQSFLLLWVLNYPGFEVQGYSFIFLILKQLSRAIKSSLHPSISPPTAYLTHFMYNIIGGIFHPFVDKIMGQNNNVASTQSGSRMIQLSIVRKPSSRFRSAWQW